MSVAEQSFRSAGRIRTIVKETAIAWVQDFRPLGRDVLIRLQSPWQANPGDLLEYELNRSAGEGSRWHASDIVFNVEVDLALLQKLDTGRGLSPTGLEELLRIGGQHPDKLRGLFGPKTSAALILQLLEWEEFPIPRLALEACLLSKKHRQAAAARMMKQALDSREGCEHLLSIRLAPEQEKVLLETVLGHEDWLQAGWNLGDKPEARLQAWYREVGDLRLLKLLEPAHWKDSLLDAWLASAEVFKEGNALSPAWSQWWEKLEAAQRIALLKKSWLLRKDSALPTALTDTDEWKLMLDAAGKDEATSEAARAELLKSEDLAPDLALSVLLEGKDGAKDPRFLKAVATSELGLDGLDDQQALQLYGQAAELEDAGLRSNFRSRLAEGRALGAELESWLVDDDKRSAALDGLAACPTFSRGLVQRLLGLQMSCEQRKSIAAAVTLKNPERWQERYLANDQELGDWREAGAPF